MVVVIGKGVPTRGRVGGTATLKRDEVVKSKAVYAERGWFVSWDGSSMVMLIKG